jgi:hypothetical protein
MFISFCASLAQAQQSKLTKPERRVALVIGNGSYATAPLKNPVNDAHDIGEALREVGFDVIGRENVSQNDMKRAIREFGQKTQNSDVALFYYAGHAVQVNGENYLIPVGATIEKPEEVEYESINVGFVLAQMTNAGSQTNIVILDACRNDPFARGFRALTRGLALMNAPGGTLIAYATAPGAVASDGNGRNGLYTEELLRNLRTPGLDVEEVFKRVRVGVRAKTQGQQTPWESSSLVSNFYFRQPNAQVIFEEHFDNNNRGWLEISNEQTVITVADGGYAWDGKIVGRNLIYKPMAIDQKQDFRIECKVTHVSGVNEFGYGLVWGAKDTDNLYSFLISGDGRFSVTRVTEAAPTRLIPWATPNSINRLNGTNKLRVEKKGDELQFFINDTFAGNVSFQPFFGDRLGFAVWNKQKVVFDDLVVTAPQK